MSDLVPLQWFENLPRETDELEFDFEIYFIDRVKRMKKTFPTLLAAAQAMPRFKGPSYEGFRRLHATSYRCGHAILFYIRESDARACFGGVDVPVMELLKKLEEGQGHPNKRSRPESTETGFDLMGLQEAPKRSRLN